MKKKEKTIGHNVITKKKSCLQFYFGRNRSGGCAREEFVAMCPAGPFVAFRQQTKDSPTPHKLVYASRAALYIQFICLPARCTVLMPQAYDLRYDHTTVQQHHHHQPQPSYPSPPSPHTAHNATKTKSYPYLRNTINTRLSCSSIHFIAFYHSFCV